MQLRSDTTQPFSQTKLLNSILLELSKSKEECVLEYEDVNPEIGDAVSSDLDCRREASNLRFSYNSLLKTLTLVSKHTTLMHHGPWFENCLDQMLVSGFLTIPDKTNLERYVGTMFRAFGPPYQASKKQPDYCVNPVGVRLPTLVIESGWSERHLYRDRDLWLRGGRGSVEVVLIIKWSKNAANLVNGKIEVFDLDAQGNVRCIQEMVIFPKPPAPASQQVILTKRQLFGANLPAGQNPAQTTHLSLDGLREIASRNIRNDGYTPA
ncbi:hypothetical protein V8E54_003885 [Elaphomyces granulatus]